MRDGSGEEGGVCRWVWMGRDDRVREGHNIFKDPMTDSGLKKSLKGFCAVFQDEHGEYYVVTECTPQQEAQGILQVIYEDGKFYNQITLAEIRTKIEAIC